jgi:hypothetical protein
MELPRPVPLQEKDEQCIGILPDFSDLIPALKDRLENSLRSPPPGFLFEHIHGLFNRIIPIGSKLRIFKPVSVGSSTVKTRCFGCFSDDPCFGENF